MTPPRNIIRVDHEASCTHAWRVTLQRHNDIAVRTFSDSINGGKRKDLRSAVEYRDELLRRYSLWEKQGHLSLTPSPSLTCPAINHLVDDHVCLSSHLLI
jgi:hypothetical protein